MRVIEYEDGLNLDGVVLDEVDFAAKQMQEMFRDSYANGEQKVPC